jgi:outer membrane autotransporter barrel domain
LLNVNRSSYTSLELPIGTRLSKTFCKDYGFDLTPELRAFWVPQLGDHSSNMRTSFVSGGSDFLVDSGKFGWQHLRFGTGITAKLNNSLSASLNYDAAIYPGQTRHLAAASMTIRF